MSPLAVQLTRLGIPETRQADIMDDLRNREDHDELLRAFSALPDDSLHNPAHEHVFVTLACQGAHPRRVLTANPTLIALIAANHRSQDAAQMQQRLANSCANATTDAEAIATLRRFKQLESMRIFLREVEDPSRVRQTSQEIAHLAQACIHVACLEVARRRGNPSLANDICVLGMGKLGGEELNFSSDIDVIFLAADSAFERMEELESYVRDIIGWLDRNTDDGYVFRVDVRLRPEGSSGALVPTVSTARAYYEAWGRTWERSALIKARPVAGNLALGESLLSDLEPFLFRKYLDYQAIDELRAMKEMIHRNAEASALVGFDAPVVEDSTPAQAPMRSRLQTKMQLFGAPSIRKSAPAPKPIEPTRPIDGSGVLGWDVKIGVGGIREVEFFVQALQLVHCGSRPGLRVKNTLDALDRLLFAGLMTHDDHASLSDAYVYFRALEHRIQMEQDRQGHRVPATETRFELLATRLGESSSELRAHIVAHRKAVRAMFDRLFNDSEQRPERPTIADASDADIETVLGVAVESLDTPEVHQLLAKLGFERPRQVAGQLIILRQKSHGPFSERAIGPDSTFARYLFSNCANAPNPDQAFSLLTRFFTLVGDRPGYYRMLSEHPHASRLLVHVFGSSPYLGAAVLREPAIVERLLGAGSVAILRSIENMQHDLNARMEPIEDPEHRMGVIRRFHQEETLRIGLHDYGGATTIVQTHEQLSYLAEVIVQTVLLEVYEPLRTRKRRQDYLLPPLAEIPFSVVAMGKLGGRELSFGSDLDLLFVYEYDRQWRLEHSFFAKIAQRLVRTLSIAGSDGKMYEVDTRLRPSGQQGALVVSLEQLTTYHAQSSELWERQALVRARPLTGPSSLRESISAVRQAEVFERPFSKQDVESMTQMLDRVRNNHPELASQIDIKYSPGGLMSIEFATQALQMAFGRAHASMQAYRTVDALKAASKLDLVDVEIEELISIFDNLRKIESRLRMTELRGVSNLPADPKLLTILGRRLGFVGEDAGNALKEEVSNLLSRSTQLVDKIFLQIRNQELRSRE